MADSLMYSISTFHTTYIILSDFSKFTFVGTIPESMYRCVSDASKFITEYKKLPASGPRPLTSEMQTSIDEVDKPKKGCKNKDKRKQIQDGPSSNLVTPKKRKSSKAEPSAPKKRKIKKIAHKLKSPSSNDSEYVPSYQDDVVILETKQEHSEYSVHEDLPNLIHTNTIPSPPPSPPHTTVPITIAPSPPPTPTSTPLPPPIFTETTTATTNTEPPLHVNASDVGAQTSGVETPNYLTTIVSN